MLYQKIFSFRWYPFRILSQSAVFEGIWGLFVIITSSLEGSCQENINVVGDLASGYFLQKILLLRDLFDMSNSIPLEEMNLRSSQHNQDLQEVVNQFLPPGNFSETQGQVDVQPRIDIPNTTSSILTSVGQSVVSSTPVSNFQSLLCAVSRVMMSDALVIVHMDKEKGVQLPATSIPITSVPIFQPRPLTIGGNSCTKRSYTRQDMPSSTSLEIVLQSVRVRVQHQFSVDAAVDNSRNKIGISVAVWNSSGEVVAAISSPLNGNLSPIMAEAKALATALNWCLII
ncbi:hypothetical protein G4B88_030171 [Cannabis sativa]|uniref:RNase H type-1 domain-containing protein n=1 Tax=Cannabis sativa TaxID=3483 RepID=A0A7J6E4Z5_CANSA|nr:hypothetical protein G4B88_030171 [Cannabis sativa]